VDSGCRPHPLPTISHAACSTLWLLPLLLWLLWRLQLASCLPAAAAAKARRLLRRGGSAACGSAKTRLRCACRGRRLGCARSRAALAAACLLVCCPCRACTLLHVLRLGLQCQEGRRLLLLLQQSSRVCALLLLLLLLVLLVRCLLVRCLLVRCLLRQRLLCCERGLLRLLRQAARAGAPRQR